MSKTKISIGGGRYCYSGPQCRLHGAQQTAQARNDLQQAYKQVIAARTPEQMLAAKQKVEAAQFAYDITSEGQKELQEQIDVGDDGFETLELEVRLRKAQKFAEQFENEYDTSRKEDKLNPEEGLKTITFNQNHTYDTPTIIPNETGAMEHGSKYAGYKDVKEIKKLVAADIKEAVNKGYLPAGLEYNTTIRRFRGGQSLVVQIRNTKDEQMFEKQHLQGGQSLDIPSGTHKKLAERVGLIAEAYNNKEALNVMNDYPYRMYYAQVRVEKEAERKTRIFEAELAKRKREQTPARESFLKKATQDLKTTVGSIPTRKVDTTRFPGDVQVGKVPETDMFLVSTSNPRTGKTKVRIYDYSGHALNPAAGQSVEEAVLDNIGRIGSPTDLLRKKPSIY